MNIFRSINYNNNNNKTFISTTTISFVLTLVAGLLFFVSAIPHQTFAQDTLTIKEALEQTFGNENGETGNQTTIAVNETRNSIGQEKEELKPVSDEMLEYSAEKFGVNLSLPRETNEQILNRIFADPEVGLQSFKNLEDAIDSIDDGLNEVQEKLYIECTVNKESGVFNKTLDCTKWSAETAKGAPVPIY